MLGSISIPAPLASCWAAQARHVEPVCPAACDCDQFPATNPFALPPAPFAKFLERENIIDRFQKSPPRPIPCTYGPDARRCEPHRADAPDLGRVIDVLA
jgi:hypothetical protein